MAKFFSEKVGDGQEKHIQSVDDLEKGSHEYVMIDQMKSLDNAVSDQVYVVLDKEFDFNECGNFF